MCLRVFNGAPFVGEAVASVLAQTYANIELVVIDDGSTDATPAILAAVADPRLKVFRQENAGLSAATMRAVALARAPFIAIIDADDVCEPERLSRQLRAFQADPQLVVAGSAMSIIDECGAYVGVRTYPAEDAAIRARALTFNPFGHSSVMYRADALRRCGSYTKRFATVEDYDVHLRILRLGRGYNFPEPLIRYRVHRASVKASKTKRQLRETIALRAVAIGEYGWRPALQQRAVDIAQRALLRVPDAAITRAFETIFYRKPHA